MFFSKAVFHLVVFLVIVLFVFSPDADSQTVNTDSPKNVKDYYLLIPEKYNGYSRAEREEYLESSDTFIDIENGYIGSNTGRLGEAFQITLFRKPGGGYVIAYNEDGDPKIKIPTKLYLLEYEDGQWTNVTDRLLPVPVNKLYSYDLPDAGTTIDVKTSKGKKVYSLTWRNGKFEKGELSERTRVKRQKRKPVESINSTFQSITKLFTD